jgi:hypothetical protein
MQHTFAEFLERNTTNASTINAMLSKIDWAEWKYDAETDPTHTLNFTTTNSIAAYNLANAYVDLKGNSSPPNYSAYKYWYSNL